MTSYGETASNGLLLQLQNFGCETYGWDIEYVNSCPMVSLLLLLRQKLSTDGHPGITLSQQEELESMSWDDLVRKSHTKIYNS